MIVYNKLKSLKVTQSKDDDGCGVVNACMNGCVIDCVCDDVHDGVCDIVCGGVLHTLPSACLTLLQFRIYCWCKISIVCPESDSRFTNIRLLFCL